MAAAALILYLAGLGLAFGWRGLVQRRRTGDTGLRLDAGPVGSVGWWATALFVAALVLGAAGPAAGLAGLGPVGVIDTGWPRWTGLVVAVAGVTALLAAQVRMGASWRVGVDPAERTTLVTGGAFALVRNPIFTAMTVTSLGLTLMVANPVAIAALLVLVGSIQLQVRAVEEPYLRRAHATDYALYAARVGRFLPGLGRLPPPTGGASSTPRSA